MPLHDWSHVPAGLFHHFHQDWSIEIARDLNRGLLPAGFSALVEQRTGLREPDFLAIESRAPRPSDSSSEASRQGPVATADRPATQIIRRSSQEFYSRRANRIVIRHHPGRIVSVIEIVSPGNKSSRAALREFVENAVDFLAAGVHLLIVDLFPPTPRDPFGIHKAIWDEIEEESFELPEGKDRVLVSYEAGDERIAYVELAGVGDVLSRRPVFLDVGSHILAPLEETYLTAWNASPLELRNAVEAGHPAERVNGSH